MFLGVSGVGHALGVLGMGIGNILGFGHHENPQNDDAKAKEDDTHEKEEKKEASAVDSTPRGTS